MADITMCQGRDCDLKEKCYRFTAKPNPRSQSMAAFDDGMSFLKDECEYFWSTEEEEE